MWPICHGALSLDDNSAPAVVKFSIANSRSRSFRRYLIANFNFRVEFDNEATNFGDGDQRSPNMTSLLSPLSCDGGELLEVIRECLRNAVRVVDRDRCVS